MNQRTCFPHNWDGFAEKLVIFCPQHLDMWGFSWTYGIFFWSKSPTADQGRLAASPLQNFAHLQDGHVFAGLAGGWTEGNNTWTDLVDYTLWLFNNHGKSPFLIGKPSINGPFSMAMLNNQRVYHKCYQHCYFIAICLKHYCFYCC